MINALATRFPVVGRNTNIEKGRKHILVCNHHHSPFFPLISPLVVPFIPSHTSTQRHSTFFDRYVRDLPRLRCPASPGPRQQPTPRSISYPQRRRPEFPSLRCICSRRHVQGRGYLQVSFPYLLASSYLTSSFSGFNFDDFPDPTHGQVNYLSQSAAQSAGLAYVQSDGTTVLAVDDTTQLGSGQNRNS